MGFLQPAPCREAILAYVALMGTLGYGKSNSNLFSFEHTYFAELGGRKAGMVLGYNWQVKRNEDWGTGFHPQSFRGRTPLHSPVVK
jgi:hypothetical protein